MKACNDCKWFQYSYGYSPAECRHDSCFTLETRVSPEMGKEVFSVRVTDFHELNADNNCEHFKSRSGWQQFKDLFPRL